jgi:uncharacterized phage protein gp47/JayE
MPQDLDLSYLGLDIDDRDPQAIFDAGLAKYLELAPDARPRNGSVEVMLMEALATASADVIYALNRFPSTAVEGILALYGVPRFAGSAAAGTVTLTLDGTRTLTVEAGQRLSDPATGLTLVVSATTTGTSITSLVVPVATEEPGGAGNAIAAGSPLDLLDSIPYVVSAEVTTSFSGGADAESDSSYVDRASTVLARVTSSLVLPSHFIAYLLQDARVTRATAIDLYEPGGTPGTDLGFITTYTYGRGAQLSSGVREELRAAMQAICSAMVTVYVEEADVITQAISLEVNALPGYSTAEVGAAVEAALATWMSPETWTWGRDIMTTEIIDIAADVTGVDYVTSVTTPASTVTLTAEQLAQAGTITVTVTS